VPAGSWRAGLALIVAVPLMASCAANSPPVASGWNPPPPAYRYAPAVRPWQPPAEIAPTPWWSDNPPDNGAAPLAVPRDRAPATPPIPPPTVQADRGNPTRRPAPTPDYDPSGEPCGWWRLCNLWD
jgi:hypothetical protein